MRHKAARILKAVLALQRRGFHLLTERSRRGLDSRNGLGAIVGFPACQAVSKQVSWRYNVESVHRVIAFAEAVQARVSSTYSNHRLSADGNPVTEDSPLHPQSLYAETKIAAEQYLLDKARTSFCAPVVFRFATLFGISPRARFDLLVNQFVLKL